MATSPLEASYQAVVCTPNKSSNWTQYITNPISNAIRSNGWGVSTATEEAFNSNFKDAIKNGSWYVAKVVDSSSSTEIMITFSSSPMWLDWSTIPNSVNANSYTPMYGLLVRCSSGSAQEVYYTNSDGTPMNVGSNSISLNYYSNTFSTTYYSSSYNTVDGSSYNVGWFPFAFDGAPDYPSGCDGDTIPSQDLLPAPASYVAMGDSYSSGEGNPPFEAGSDTNWDTCHRSPQAYPRLLESDLSLGSTAFVACSGAKINNVINGQNGEDPQLDSLSSSTETATITIGGNDIGFADFATACYWDTCAVGTTAYNTAVGKIQTELVNDSQLVNLYKSILDRMTKSGSRLYVIGYPEVAPSSVSYGNLVCPYLTPDPEVGVGDDATGVYDLISQLDGAISDAVSTVNSDGAYTGRIQFVDPTTEASPFDGHDVCNYSSYFIGADPNSSGPFHPNKDGQAAYASIIEDAMS